jgi:hypothetical protein
MVGRQRDRSRRGRGYVDSAEPALPRGRHRRRSGIPPRLDGLGGRSLADAALLRTGNQVELIDRCANRGELPAKAVQLTM